NTAPDSAALLSFPASHHQPAPIPPSLRSSVPGLYSKSPCFGNPCHTSRYDRNEWHSSRASQNRSMYNQPALPSAHPSQPHSCKTDTQWDLQPVLPLPDSGQYTLPAYSLLPDWVPQSDS